jgi:hypothetical protein
MFQGVATVSKRFLITCFCLFLGALATPAISLGEINPSPGQAPSTTEIPATIPPVSSTSLPLFARRLVLNNGYTETEDCDEFDLGDDESFTVEAWFNLEDPSPGPQQCKGVELVRKDGNYRLYLWIRLSHRVHDVYWL